MKTTLIFFTLIIGLSSCTATNRNYSSYVAPQRQSVMYRDGQAIFDPITGGFGAAATSAGDVRYAPTEAKNVWNERLRQLTYNAQLTLEVDSNKVALDIIQAQAQQIGGYTSSYSDNSICVRIPNALLQSFMQSITKLGHARYSNVSADDISDEYYDTEMRLNVADSVRVRYVQLLARAENVEAALKVERELERIQTEIERLKGRLQLMQHNVQMASVNVYLINGVKSETKPGPLGYVFVGLYTAVKWLFVWE